MGFAHTSFIFVAEGPFGATHYLAGSLAPVLAEVGKPACTHPIASRAHLIFFKFAAKLISPKKMIISYKLPQEVQGGLRAPAPSDGESETFGVFG